MRKITEMTTLRFLISNWLEDKNNFFLLLERKKLSGISLSVEDKIQRQSYLIALTSDDVYLTTEKEIRNLPDRTGRYLKDTVLSVKYAIDQNVYYIIADSKILRKMEMFSEIFLVEEKKIRDWIEIDMEYPYYNDEDDDDDEYNEDDDEYDDEYDEKIYYNIKHLTQSEMRRQ